MAKFNITAKVSDGAINVTLNGKKILAAAGNREIQIKDGDRHVVQWFVKAAPGTNYSIKITSPVDAEVNFTKTLKSEGKDYGGFSFNA